MTRFLAWSCLSMALILGGCTASSNEDERVCDSTDSECSCQSLADNWCIMYHGDSGELEEGECADLGGEEVKERCPSARELGRCHEIDDCHSPAYIFYEDYTGGFKDYSTIEDLEMACNEGELVGYTCAEWSTP